MGSWSRSFHIGDSEGSDKQQSLLSVHLPDFEDTWGEGARKLHNKSLKSRAEVRALGRQSHNNEKALGENIAVHIGDIVPSSNYILNSYQSLSKKQTMQNRISKGKLQITTTIQCSYTLPGWLNGTKCQQLARIWSHWHSHLFCVEYNWYK